MKLHSILFFFVFTLFENLDTTAAKRLLASEIKCKPLFNISANFLISTNHAIDVNDNDFYEVKTCNPDAKNKDCRGRHAVWNRKYCTQELVNNVYSVKCLLTPPGLKVTGIPDVWIIQTFVLKFALKRSLWNTYKRLFPITPILKCQDAFYQKVLKIEKAVSAIELK